MVCWNLQDLQQIGLKMIFPQVQEHNATTGKILMREMTEAEKSVWSENLEQPTIEEKLASVGLTLPDLKAALGL
jgi:hypothetical protein